MHISDEDIVARVTAGEPRAIARLITLVENRVPRGRTILARLFSRTGRAQVIGVTGSPGAGKSTLVDQLALVLHKQGKRVAILAIDPTSPFSGGAVLGDRIRMSAVAEHAAIFIRSMATRGSLGGTSRATLDAVRVLDAAGFDFIFVETVGVGQAEVDIIKTADSCLVVLVPGMGDSVQAIKAGILEIADLFIINKADRDGADMLQKDLRVLLSLAEYGPTDWEPPILRTVATTGSGAAEVIVEAVRHGDWLKTTQEGRKRKLRMLKESIINMASGLLLERMLSATEATLDQKVLECFEHKTDPFSAVEYLVEALQSRTIKPL